MKTSIRVLAARFVVVLAFSLAAACGGGGDAAMNTGACVEPFSMAWPSEEDAQFCLLPWTAANPAMELTECDEVLDNCSNDGPEPNFECLGDGTEGLPASPETVTLKGFVDVFSSGPNSDSARVFIYRESDLPESVSDFDTIDAIATFDIELNETTLAPARACPKETDFMQGECVLPTDDCGGDCEKDLEAGNFCFESECIDLQRWEVEFEIPDIPANQFLVVRSVGIDSEGEPQVLDNSWSQMVQYNVFFSAADRNCNAIDDMDCFDADAETPTYKTEINLISSQDYRTIPTSAGLSAGIAPGKGVFAGEVHDCDSIRLQHVQLGFPAGEEARVLAYFNGNPVRTLPRLQQSTLGTNSLGLYAGLELDAGPNSVVAIGVRDGAVEEIGRFRARVWPDSVTLVRLGGGRPAQ